MHSHDFGNISVTFNDLSMFLFQMGDNTEAVVETSPDSEKAEFTSFSALRSDETHAYVTLQVGSKQYPVHKLILTTVRPVFLQMFCGTWKENEESLCFAHRNR